MNLGNEKKLEIERESKRSLSLENSVWKRVWTCRKTLHGGGGGGGVDGYARLTLLPRRLIFMFFAVRKET